MHTPSEITCLRPEQLPIWTSEDGRTSSLDVLLLMAANMAFAVPDLYAQGKQYGSQVLQELTENLLGLMYEDVGSGVEATWFHANVEVLQQLRDRVIRDLRKERLVGGKKIIVGPYSSLESIERHIIPQHLIEHALLYRARCNACGKELEAAPSTRTRGIYIPRDFKPPRDGGIQEIIDDLVRKPRK
jgi:hypothetical protein